MFYKAKKFFTCRLGLKYGGRQEYSDHSKEKTRVEEVEEYRDEAPTPCLTVT